MNIYVVIENEDHTGKVFKTYEEALAYGIGEIKKIGKLYEWDFDSIQEEISQFKRYEDSQTMTLYTLPVVENE